MESLTNLTYKQEYYLKNKETILQKSAARYQKNKKRALVFSWLSQIRRKYWPDCTRAQVFINYGRLEFEQDYKCAICKKPEVKKDPQNGKISKLAVDHCHTSKKVRGLLCFQCNTKLGWLTARKQTILDYLEAAE